MTTHTESEPCWLALPRCCLGREGRKATKGRSGSDTSSLRTGAGREEWRRVCESLARVRGRLREGTPRRPRPGEVAPPSHSPTRSRLLIEESGLQGGEAQLLAGGPGPQGHWLTLVPKQTPLRPPGAPRWHPKAGVSRGQGASSPSLLAQPLIPSSHPSRPRSLFPFSGAGPERRFQPLQSTWDCALLQADPQPPLPPGRVSTSNGVNVPTPMMLNKVPFHAQSFHVCFLNPKLEFDIQN